jgi:hypothetical protein
MREEVGTMQFKSSRGANKKMMKEGKNEYKEKRGKEKKNMCEKIKI